LITDHAQIPEQLVIVGLAVRQTFPLVVPVPEEGFLALCAHEVLYVPVLPERRDDALLDRSPAGSAYGDSHLVVAAEAVQLVELVGGVAWPRAHLPGGGRELLLTVVAAEVVRVIHLAPESERLPVYEGVAFLAHVFAQSGCFHLGIAIVAQGPALVLDEAEVRQFFMTHLTCEAVGVPGHLHGLNNSSYDELAALVAAGGEQHMKVVLAVLPSFKLVKHSVRERSEALGADEALRVEQLPVRVDDLGFGLEAVVASRTGHAIHVDDSWHGGHATSRCGTL